MNCDFPGFALGVRIHTRVNDKQHRSSHNFETLHRTTMMLKTLVKREGKKGKLSEKASVRSLLLLCAAVTVALVGIVLSSFSSKTYLPWHQTPQWERFLQMYDQKAKEMFATCDSKLVNTQFGRTQVHVCGNASDPVVVLFHGASMSSPMFGRWILPDLVRQKLRVVAVDFPCDNGRSIPADFSRCQSATEDEVANWVQDFVTELGMASKPVSLLGYSYGALVAFVTAMRHPAMVDQLVLLSPGSIFAPFHATRFVLFHLLMSILPESLHSQGYRWFFEWMAGTPKSDVWGELNTLKDFTLSAGRVWATHLPLFTNVYNDTVLQEVFRHHNTYLGIGEYEVVTDVAAAIERARNNGVAVVDVYPEVGHLLALQCPELVSSQVAKFLSRKLDE